MNLIKYTIILNLFISCGAFPQKTYPSIELFMQSDCDQGYEIEFKLESVSPTWDYDMYTGVFSITNNTTILNSSITIEGTDLSK